MKLSLLVLTSILGLALSSSDDYESLFNALLTEEEKSPPGLEAIFYCVRYYTKELELTERPFKLNPKQVDTLSVNCNLIIAEQKQAAAEAMASDQGLSEKQKQCVVDKFLKGKYFNAMALVVTLGQLKTLTMAEVDEEKRSFVAAMHQMTEDLNKCVEPHKKKEKKSKEE